LSNYETIAKIECVLVKKEYDDETWTATLEPTMIPQGTLRIDFPYPDDDAEKGDTVFLCLVAK